jgi:hypothetical protein
MLEETTVEEAAGAATGWAGKRMMRILRIPAIMEREDATWTAGETGVE